MNILEEDANYLRQSMKAGEVVLILGAGASADSLNAQSGPVKQSRALAKAIAERAGLPYNGEDLAVVLSAVKLQDAQQRIDLDVYPAVTLANGHLSVLIKHNDLSRARALASEYFDHLQQLDKQIDAPAVRSMKEKVFRFATLGEWYDKSQTSPSKKSGRRSK